MTTSIPRDSVGRPLLNRLLPEWIDHIARLRPEALGHVRSSAIICVAGAARRQSRASVRPMRFAPGATTHAGPWTKPEITIRGTPILYEICLRPRFFLSASPEERLRILVHELWHMSPRFDGTLDEARRHGPSPEVSDEAARIATGLRLDDLRGGSVLEHDGELRMQAWLARPPSRIRTGDNLRLAYSEDDLFSAVVIQNGRGVEAPTVVD